MKLIILAVLIFVALSDGSAEETVPLESALLAPAEPPKVFKILLPGAANITGMGPVLQMHRFS